MGSAGIAIATGSVAGTIDFSILYLVEASGRYDTSYIEFEFATIKSSVKQLCSYLRLL